MGMERMFRTGMRKMMMWVRSVLLLALINPTNISGKRTSCTRLYPDLHPSLCSFLYSFTGTSIHGRRSKEYLLHSLQACTVVGLQGLQRQLGSTARLNTLHWQRAPQEHPQCTSERGGSYGIMPRQPRNSGPIQASTCSTTSKTTPKRTLISANFQNLLSPPTHAPN